MLVSHRWSTAYTAGPPNPMAPWCMTVINICHGWCHGCKKFRVIVKGKPWTQPWFCYACLDHYADQMLIWSSSVPVPGPYPDPDLMWRPGLPPSPIYKWVGIVCITGELYRIYSWGAPYMMVIFLIGAVGGSQAISTYVLEEVQEKTNGWCVLAIVGICKRIYIYIFAICIYIYIYSCSQDLFHIDVVSTVWL